MIPNKVDVVFSEQDLQEIMAALKTIRQKLSFAVGLSPEEKQQIAKIGLKSQTFTEKALSMAEQHPELMPGCFSLEAAKRDMALFATLNPILQSLSEMRALVEDTQMVVGSEAYAAARMAYKAAKTYGKGIGLDDVIGDLAQRFQKNQAASVSKAS